MMKLRLFGLVSLVLMAVPGPVPAKSNLSPWGMMNEFGPWDREDVLRQRLESMPHKPLPPARPIRTRHQLETFSRPVNHASVDIDIHLEDVPVFARGAGGVRPYDVSVRVLTPEFPAMAVVGHPAKEAGAGSKQAFDLICEIESIRRWDRENTYGWKARIAVTFNDEGTVKQLEKAKTLLIAHGVCYSATPNHGLLSDGGFYEYHAAFVSRFEDTDQAGVMMEIGTGMRFNSAGNGYFFEPSLVRIAFTGVGDQKQVRIKYR